MSPPSSAVRKRDTKPTTVYGSWVPLAAQATRPLHASRATDVKRVQVAAAHEGGSGLVARRAPRKPHPPGPNGSGLARLSRGRHHRGQRSGRARRTVFRPHADEDPLARLDATDVVSVGEEGAGRGQGRRVLVREDQEGSVSAMARQRAANR